MDNAEAVDVVERLVRKRNSLFRIRDFESARHPEELEALARHLDRIRREIDASVVGAVFRELEAVRRDAAPDFEHVFALIVVERSDGRHMPLTFAEAVP